MSTSLTDQLALRIERSGPITFAEFMNVALYDPDGGFYERGAGSASGAIGTNGDFVTSPHVSPLFGALLARQVAEFDEILGEPAAFAVLEAGAGDGTLAEEIAGSLAGTLRERGAFVLAERTARHRALIEARRPRIGLPTRIVDDVVRIELASLDGCVLANELLDNLPFHLVRGTPDGSVELYVGLGGGAAFELTEGPVSSGHVERLAPPLLPGEEATVPAGAVAFVEGAAGALRRGYILLIDYAAGAGGTGAVHGYRRQGVVGDVLADPGSSDVTAGVDLGIVAAHARGLGLRVWGPVAQRDALTALGFAEQLEALRREQVASLDRGRGTEAVRAYSSRSAASLLVERGGLGDFAVLCLGKGVDAIPRCMRDFNADGGSKR